MRSSTWVTSSLLVAGLFAGQSNAHACAMPRMHPANMQVANNLRSAEQRLREGDAQGALDEAKAILASNQEMTPYMRMKAHRVAGLAALKLRQLEQARTHLESAPEEPQVVEARAETLVELGRHKDAEAVLVPFSHVHPLTAHGEVIRARIEVATGSHAQAHHALQRALKLDPQLREAHVLQASLAPPMRCGKLAFLTPSHR